ncbi:Morn repeat-containing protein 5 [Globisporangium polare]
MGYEDGGVSGGELLVNVAKVLLLLVNMAFMVAGAMLVYFSHRVKTSGWLDAFEGDYAWIGTTTFLLTLILGAVVMGLAALGCFGALLRQKLLLTMYAVVLVLTLIFFVVIAIGAHSVNAKATAWDAAQFPAVESERSIGENFNQLYCAAQVPYYCEDAGVNDVLSMFNLSLPGSFSSTTTNFSSLCGVVNVAQVDTVCKVCALVSKYDQYSAVLDWAQEQCPRNAKNQVWCGSFLLSGGNVTSQGSAVENNAPYGQCRPVFFDLIEKWSSFLLGCAIGVCVATIAVFALTMVLRCKSSASDHDDELYPSAATYPTRANTLNNIDNNQQQYGNTAQTQQQYGNTYESQQQQYGYTSTQQQQQQQYGYTAEQLQYQQQQQQYGQANVQYGYSSNQQQQYGNQRASGKDRFFI